MRLVARANRFGVRLLSAGCFDARLFDCSLHVEPCGAFLFNDTESDLLSPCFFDAFGESEGCLHGFAWGDVERGLHCWVAWDSEVCLYADGVGLRSVFNDDVDDEVVLITWRVACGLECASDDEWV